MDQSTRFKDWLSKTLTTVLSNSTTFFLLDKVDTVDGVAWQTLDTDALIHVFLSITTTTKVYHHHNRHKTAGVNVTGYGVLFGLGVAVYIYMWVWVWVLVSVRAFGVVVVVVVVVYRVCIGLYHSIIPSINQ